MGTKEWLRLKKENKDLNERYCELFKKCYGIDRIRVNNDDKIQKLRIPTIYELLKDGYLEGGEKTFNALDDLVNNICFLKDECDVNQDYHVVLYCLNIFLTLRNFLGKENLSFDQFLEKYPIIANIFFTYEQVKILDEYLIPELNCIANKILK